MTGIAFRRLWTGAVLALALFIIWSSLSPQPLVPSATLPDKAGHFLAYLSLGLLGSGITAPHRLRIAMLRCFLLGAALEVLQGLLTEHRHAEWGDLAANSAGILTAWLITGWGRAGWALHAWARLQRGGRS